MSTALLNGHTCVITLVVLLTIGTFEDGSPLMEVIYTVPCDLRPLHLMIPSILRPAISDNSYIFNINILPFNTTSNLRPQFCG